MNAKRSLNCIFLVALSLFIAIPFPWVEAATELTPKETEEPILFDSQDDEITYDGLLIDGPSEVPTELIPEWEASTLSTLDRTVTLVAIDFPSYSWVYGSSAVSAAMIAAHYDSNGFDNMYSGLTNGGIMPTSDMVGLDYDPSTGIFLWGTWNDGNETYPNNPLVASHIGVDGQLVRGSIDDYWVKEGSEEDDPYITGSWSQHIWGLAVGDYLKTGQSIYNFSDGHTLYFNAPWNDGQTTCVDMESLTVVSEGNNIPLVEIEGTYGLKLFYEARGYTVTDCYNQLTDNHQTNGFGLAEFQAEIDNGNPVLLNLDSDVYGAHSVVGYGYDGSTIYIRDTWDSDPRNHHSMTWTGAYSGTFYLDFVSIVHIEQPSSQPSAFAKSSPANGIPGQFTNPTLSWEAASGTFEYEYCIDTIDNGSCDTSWVSTDVLTSVNLSGLLTETTYYWQVRAINPVGTTDADGTFWEFTTSDAINSFLPFIMK